MPIRARLALFVSLASLPATAAAQLPETPYVVSDGRVTLGGEVSITASPTDPDAYFNYTDYDHNALRTFRARLIGEWRAGANLSFLGELRLENNDSLQAAALYLRWRPWAHRDFDVQAGRIPPVIGAFARHAYGRDDLVIGIPLAYQYLTSLRPDALPASANDLLRMRARGWRPSFPIGSQGIDTGVPMVTAFDWPVGVEAHAQIDRWDLSGAITRGTPAYTQVLGAPAQPTWSGRAAFSARSGLTIGVSGARGQWITDAALDALPATASRDAAQSIVGADAELGIGRVLVRAEWLRSAFDMPAASEPRIASPLVAAAAFVEARYRWNPRWQTAARVEHLGFSDITGTLAGGQPVGWDAAVKRIEGVIGFRAARNVELRAGWQENWRDAGRVLQQGYPTAQVLYWF